MGLRNVLRETELLRTDGRPGGSDTLRNRLESSAARIDQLSTWARDAARRRASDAAERAVDELLERALRERPPASDGAANVDGVATGTDAGADGSIDDPLAEACSRLRARMNSTDDRSVGDLAADLLERDAVAVAHDLERVLTEELSALVAEIESEMAPPASSEAARSRAGSVDAAVNDGSDGEDATGQEMSVPSRRLERRSRRPPRRRLEAA